MELLNGDEKCLETVHVYIILLLADLVTYNGFLKNSVIKQYNSDNDSTLWKWLQYL